MDSQQPEVQPAPTPAPPLTPLAQLVITSFERKLQVHHDRRIIVNPVVSKFATWYEKLRNAMEYHEDEVILRAAIERILKRLLLLGGNAQTSAEPLVRELLWARYLPENSASHDTVETVEKTMDLYLRLRFQILKHHRLPEATVNEWIYHLMSSAIEHIVNPNVGKETMANFMFQVIKEQMSFPDESEETKNAQVYIGVRRAFARDDIAFMRYHLFRQYFGELTTDNVDTVAQHFKQGYQEIITQLQFKGKEKIYNFVKRRAAAFLILEDVFRQHKGKVDQLLLDEEAFDRAVMTACQTRYQGISSKVKRAIVRSVIFIILTKVLFAFLVEGTYERIVYGHIIWPSIIINTTIPPLLMIIVSFFIRTPGEENSKRILGYIKALLHDDKPRLGSNYVITRRPDQRPITMIFSILWLLAFLLSFGAMSLILTKLQFNIVNQGIFMFFLTIVSFLSYRISLMAHTYSVGERQGLITPLVDFLFLPVVRVGRQLTTSISRFNFMLFIVDFFIETPFKVIFGFFEQWFSFLHSKRDELE